MSLSRNALTVLAIVMPSALALAQAAAPEPQTRAERSGWTETSTYADVLAHLRAVEALPHGDRLELSVFAKTLYGKPLPVVTARLEGKKPSLRALINANIHGGEVEGKEVVQILLREIANGQHEDILEHVEITFVPIFNADGNDEMNPRNRRGQNGPDSAGQRPNGQNLDLNRDFVKAESPEVRGMLRLFRERDPHLFMDLHTTNGSYHGYHLTYSPSLSPNVDPAIAGFCFDEFLPAVREATKRNFGVRVFDYGNFRRDPTSGWRTYSAQPRYGTNYFGLRNRISVLSEAYSYLSFEKRVAATKAFVLENLRAAVAKRDAIARMCRDADHSLVDPEGEPPAFETDIEFAPPVMGELLVGSAKAVQTEGGVRRMVADEEYEAVQAPLYVRFQAKAHAPMPFCWAIVGTGDAVRATLLRHGIAVEELTEGAEVAVEEFRPTEISRPRRAFQGHLLVQLGGKTVKGRRSLPAGSLIVSARQPLARVAAQLLEAESDDSLATWNFFDGAIHRDEEAGDGLAYPVLRLVEPVALATRPCALREVDDEVERPLMPKPDEVSDFVEVRIVCDVPGERVASHAFESEVVWQGRELHWELGETVFERADVAVREAGSRARGKPLVVVRGPDVTWGEAVDLSRIARKSGVEQVYVIDRGR